MRSPYASIIHFCDSVCKDKTKFFIKQVFFKKMNKKDIQQFFIERFDELFHKDTIDSYRVRNQNAYTILYELIEVIENWSDGRISFLIL